MTTAAIGDSGIVLGAIDALGVRWRWQRGSDLFGNAPAPRDVSGERAVAHGTWSATEFYGPRSWSVSMIVEAPDHDRLHEARARFFAAFGIQAFLVVGDEPHFGQREATFRRVGETLWSEDTPTMARASVSLHADDPLIRGSLLSIATGAPSTSGGLVWPATWPANWDATVSSGRLTLENDGSEPASILWRIDGPVIDPYLIDIATGQTLRTNITLAAGEFITIDTATHRVLAQGDPFASRRDRVYGDWFDARPGTTQVQFGATSPGPSAQVTASWRPTWI